MKAVELLEVSKQRQYEIIMSKLVEVANLGYTSLVLAFNDQYYLFEETIERLTDDGFDVISCPQPFYEDPDSTPLPNGCNPTQEVTILWREAAEGKKGEHL